MKKKFIYFAILVSGFLFTNCRQSQVEPIKLGEGPHLFIDNYLIAENSFLSRTVNNPDKLPEPVVLGGLDKDNQFQPYMSVLKDAETGKFRLWYNTSINDVETHQCHLGYMESEDGINWEHPHKLLKDPHKIQFGVTVLDRGVDWENPQQRYVFATYIKPGLKISFSPDGIDWTAASEEPELLHNHDITSVHWDPIRKQYFAAVSHRLNGFADPKYPTADDRRRIPHISTSKDLMNWEEIKPLFWPKIGAPIERGETQFYSMSGVITRGELMIGLVKILRDDVNATPGKTAKQMGDMNRKAAGIGYTVLAWTRDGVTWQRDHQPFLDRNMFPGTWDHAMAWGDEQIIVDDETYVYYAGYKRGHKVARFIERSIGVAKLPIDRYVSRDAELNEGTLITKPVTISAETMTVNANIQGKIKVRVLDANHNPIEGFDYVSLRGDSVKHNVQWEKALNALSGETVCLEFKVNDAQLFGFDLH
ncbi:hypothetical protein ACFLR4_04080 [Bacteroidota bacterium]